MLQCFLGRGQNFHRLTLVTFSHCVRCGGGGKAVGTLSSYLPPRVGAGGHMPSRLRIYLGRGLDRVFHLLCGFLLPFWGRLGEMLDISYSG